jgi:hypothetical protein
MPLNLFKKGEDDKKVIERVNMIKYSEKIAKTSL